MEAFDPKRTIPRPPRLPINVLGMWTVADGYRYFNDLTPEEIKGINDPPDLQVDWLRVWQ